MYSSPLDSNFTLNLSATIWKNSASYSSSKYLLSTSTFPLFPTDMITFCKTPARTQYLESIWTDVSPQCNFTMYCRNIFLTCSTSLTSPQSTTDFEIFELSTNYSTRSSQFLNVWNLSESPSSSNISREKHSKALVQHNLPCLSVIFTGEKFLQDSKEILLDSRTLICSFQQKEEVLWVRWIYQLPGTVISSILFRIVDGGLLLPFSILLFCGWHPVSSPDWSCLIPLVFGISKSDKKDCLLSQGRGMFSVSYVGAGDSPTIYGCGDSPFGSSFPGSPPCVQCPLLSTNSFLCPVVGSFSSLL